MLTNIVAVLLFMAFLTGIVLVLYSVKHSDNLGPDSPLDKQISEATHFWHPEG